VWGSTFPFNPYPFPWANHLFQDSPSVAMGVFEGHMAKMADGFKAARTAELELADQYKPGKSEAELTYFDWRQFSDEEWALCPPGAATARCMTSASWTCPACWPRASPSRCWWLIRRSIPTPAVRPAPRASWDRFPTWRSSARPFKASRSRGRRSA